jgi:hypothetical protein
MRWITAAVFAATLVTPGIAWGAAPEKRRLQRHPAGVRQLHKEIKGMDVGGRDAKIKTFVGQRQNLTQLPIQSIEKVAEKASAETRAEVYRAYVKEHADKISENQFLKLAEQLDARGIEKLTKELANGAKGRKKLLSNRTIQRLNKKMRPQVSAKAFKKSQGKAERDLYDRDFLQIGIDQQGDLVFGMGAFGIDSTGNFVIRGFGFLYFDLTPKEIFNEADIDILRQEPSFAETMSEDAQRELLGGSTVEEMSAALEVEHNTGGDPWSSEGETTSYEMDSTDFSMD